jgi:hypothetical protein
MRKNTEIREVIKGFNKRGIRYLLIGRQAVMLYGAPLFSYDFDFWIHPEERDRVYSFLEDELGFEVSSNREQKKPLVFFYTQGGDKIDVFFFRNTVNKNGEKLNIDECLKNAIKIKEPDSDLYVMVPSIDNLIKLKKIGDSPKDLEDIEYLEKIKKMKRAGKI